MITLKLFNSSGQIIAIAPDWTQVAFTDKMNAEGTVTIDYAKQGRNYSTLATSGTEGALFDEDGGEIPGSRFTVSEKSGERLSKGDTEGIQGSTWLSRLKDAIVYPPSWPSTTPKDYAFENATPGKILGDLLEAAEGRGADVAVKSTWSFTDVVDSDGNAWSNQVSISFKPGTTLLSVLQGLIKLGMCDVRTEGREIKLYDVDMMGVDRSTGSGTVLLSAGRDLQDAPKNTSVRELISTALVEGENNAMVEVVDSTAVAQWDRREGFISQSGIADTGTLTVIGQTQIDIVDHERQELSHKLTLHPDGPKPFKDYFPGDKVLTDVEGAMEAYVVMQLSLTWDAEGGASGAVTLNDRFDALEVKLSRTLDRFGDVVVSPTSPPDDTVAPGKVLGLNLSSLAYMDDQGNQFAQISADWLDIAANVDGSAITDFSHYELEYRPTGDTVWQGGITTTESNFSFSGLPTNTAFEVRVRAVDKDNNRGEWSDIKSIVTDEDAGPPPIPSAPVVTPFLQTLRITWNGLGSAGETMPSDFAYTEVHLSTVNNFTPSSATQVDALPAAGTAVLTNLTPGTTYYAKLISVDRTGNKSDPSDQDSGVPEEVVATDIGGNVIGLDHIQFKDVTNHIADGSFELSQRRADVLSGQNTAIWSFVNSGADHGSWCLKGTNSASPSTTRLLPLTPVGAGDEIQIAPDDRLYARIRYKGDVGSNGGMGFRIAWRNSAGSVTNVDLLTGSTADGSWRTLESQWQAPAGAVSWAAYVYLNSSASTGAWYFDRVEVREVVDSAIIANLAVTTAKIANLAVNDAKIADLSVGKITAGTLTSDITVSARIKTANSGQRVEMNNAGVQMFNSGGTQLVNIGTSGTFYLRSASSGARIQLDGSGLKAYNSGGIQTVDISSTGNVSLIGQLSSGASGNRIVFSPIGSTYPEIRFYEDDGTSYSRIVSPPRGSGDQTNFQMISSNRWSSVSELKLNEREVYLAYSYGGGTPNYIGIIESHIVLQLDRYSSYISLNWDGLTITGSDHVSIQTYPSGGPIWLFGDVRAEGSFRVNGNSKTFIIDHPDDEDRYLVHAATESPHNGVEYWGEVEIGPDGQAVVMLPSYFESLVADEGRVVLVGCCGHVPVEVSATTPRYGCFTVYGDPGSRAAWLVKGVRKDVPPLFVEPGRDEIVVTGNGPYRSYVEVK